jgi:hypothetical protein
MYVVGFAFTCGSGKVHLFEKNTSSKYSKRNVFLIPESEYQEPSKGGLNTVQTLSISPEEKQLLATAMRSQIFSVKLWGTSITQVHETDMMPHNQQQEDTPSYIYQSRMANIFK